MRIGPHVFPTTKYALIHERLSADPYRVGGMTWFEAEPASWEQLALVHTTEYLNDLRDGTLSAQALDELELPWSAEMVDGFRVMVGGTIAAARMACGSESDEPAIVCHVGGGLHHAFPNHGEGFCPFNDVAIAIRVLQAEGVQRHAVVDLDVHHGNGTAFVFNPGGADLHGSDASSGAPGDPGVFTFSMHQQHNYPVWKPRGSLDIGLPDGTGDDTYLRELSAALPVVMAHRPRCVFYLAGADPYEDDQLGGLRLTKEGLRLRDRMVIEAVRSARLPLVIVLAGGYARRLDDTVAIHCATMEEALRST